MSGGRTNAGPQREERRNAPERIPPTPPVPQNGSGSGSPTGGGDAPTTTPSVTAPTLGKPEIESAINRGIGGSYGPGAGYLADKWIAEAPQPLTATEVTSKIRATANLYASMIAAWRGAKASDEAFVKEFGQPDTIAVQKFADIDGESIIEGSITNAKRQFYAAVKAKISEGRVARAAIYPLLKSAAAPFQKKGMKIAQSKLGEMAQRAHGIEAFYDYNLTNAKRAETEQETLQELAVEAGWTAAGWTMFRDENPQALQSPGGRALLRQKFRKKAAGAGDLKGWGQDQSVVGNPNNPGWFSPDEINVRESPDEGYNDLMTMFALQPEWYPEGALALQIDVSAGIRNARKPTAFDGMMSPLWVSRPQDEQTFGVTGGAAREYVADAPKWHTVRAATPHAISDDYAGQLRTLATQYSRRDTSAQTGERGTGASTSATEQLLRGELGTTAAPRAEALGHHIARTSANEARNPSQVPGNADTNGAAPATPAGGTFGSTPPAPTPGGAGTSGSGSNTSGGGTSNNRSP